MLDKKTIDVLAVVLSTGILSFESPKTLNPAGASAKEDLLADEKTTEGLVLTVSTDYSSSLMDQVLLESTLGLTEVSLVGSSVVVLPLFDSPQRSLDIFAREGRSIVRLVEQMVIKEVDVPVVSVDKSTTKKLPHQIKTAQAQFKRGLRAAQQSQRSFKVNKRGRGFRGPR